MRSRSVRTRSPPATARSYISCWGRDQATAAEDYDRAGELKGQLESRRGELEEKRKGRSRAPEVTAEDIAEIVSRATGIPVSQLTTEERERLMRREEELHGRIVGQDEAVAAVADAVRRSPCRARRSKPACNTIVIMTSNFGADRIQAYARSGGDFDRLKDELMDILRGSFRPEFINRIDDIIVFRALTDEQLADITQLSGDVEAGDKVVVDADGDQLTFDVERLEEPTPPPA